jgi:hypothetical protein
MVNRLYLQYNYDSSNLSFSKKVLSLTGEPPSEAGSAQALSLL